MQRDHVRVFNLCLYDIPCFSCLKCGWSLRENNVKLQHSIKLYGLHFIHFIPNTKLYTAMIRLWELFTLWHIYSERRLLQSKWWRFYCGFSMIISGVSISRSMRTMTLSVPVNGAGYPNTNRKQSELLRFSLLCSNFINSRDKKSISSSVTFTCMSLTSIHCVYI